MYTQCARINPRSAQAYLAIGFTYHLRFDLIQALKYYHKAHFLRSEDSLIEELINKAIEHTPQTENHPIETTYPKS